MDALQTLRRFSLLTLSNPEANEHQWPDGWVKGRGFRFTTEPEPGPVEEHPLLEFGTAYVRRLTNADALIRARGNTDRHT